MGINPCCCGITLQKGSKIIAILQIIGGARFLIASIVAVITATTSPKLKGNDDTNEEKKQEPDSAVIVILFVFIGGSIVAIVMAIVLWFGASDKNLRKCYIWLIVRLIILVAMVAGLILQANYIRQEEEAVYLIPTVITIVFDTYCVAVVYCFAREVKMERNTVSAEY